MPWVPDDRLNRFSEAFQRATHRIGDGRAALDTTTLREAVRVDKDAAHRFIEIHLAMAASSTKVIGASRLTLPMPASRALHCDASGV